MNKLFNILAIIAILCFATVLATSCDKDEDGGGYSGGGNSGGTQTPVTKVTAPVFDMYLTTTTLYDVSFRGRFINGGDTWQNMSCKVHWRKYYSKPSVTPKASDMNQHETMRQYANTKTKITFDRTHSSFRGGEYVYYYFECSNSRYTTKTPVTFCVVKK